MESSEEEDDFPTHEWITPQSSVNSIYQSDTEKGIRRLCSELLDLKDAVENLSGNTQSKYLAFLRISEEVIEVEQELIELQKHVSDQGILVQDLMSGVCRELEIWNKFNTEESDTEQDLQLPEVDELLHGEVEDKKAIFLETVDILLAEHKVEEALLALDAEERCCPELNDSVDVSSSEPSVYKEAFLKRKEILVDQLVRISERPSVCNTELKRALHGLVKLGRGSLSHQLLLKAYSSRLHKSIESFLPSCSEFSETYAASLSQLVFSTISVATKESVLIFEEVPTYINRIVQWAEYEIESFVRLVKENSPPPETAGALRSASICIQASISHCSFLESQGLKFSKLLMVLLRPHIEEVLDLNFRRARRMVSDLARNGDIIILSPQPGSPNSLDAPSIFTGSGKMFMSIVKGILEPLTPMVVLHFGGTILSRLLQLFDKYVEKLIKALPGPSEDENPMDNKEPMELRAETDAQQLALLGTAFTVADELLPIAVTKIFTPQNENKDEGCGYSESIGPVAISGVEYKEWRRHLQYSLDKLRDSFCRQYVLTFIYSREGKARLDARMYLEGKGDDLFWDSDPLPSLPFQALFARLQQVASVAGDVLLGKEKVQKILLSRLTETVVMWLSEEQEFWDVFESDSIQLQPCGLQQLILDMHFIVEIAICGGYSSRNVHQLVSAIITRAIGTFSARGIDPQSALPEDEWFVDTAKAAINKLLLGTSGSESSSDVDPDEHVILHDVDPDEHIILHDVDPDGHIILHDDDDDDDISNSDETPSSPTSSCESTDSFASANMEETDSPVHFTDPEA